MPMTFGTALFLLHSFQISNRATMVSPCRFPNRASQHSRIQRPLYGNSSEPQAPALITTYAFLKFGFLPASVSTVQRVFLASFHLALFSGITDRSVIPFIKIWRSSSNLKLIFRFWPRPAFMAVLTWPAFAKITR